MAERKKTKYYGTTGLFAETIGESLNHFHKDKFNKSSLELLRLGSHWHQVVGHELSASSRPLKLHYTRQTGSIHISATASAALEIQHMQPVLLQRCATLLGHRKVTQIKLMQSS